MHRNVEGCSKCESPERGELFLRRIFEQLGAVPIRPEQAIVAFGTGGVRRLADVLRDGGPERMKNPGLGYRGHRHIAKAAEKNVPE